MHDSTTTVDDDEELLVPSWCYSCRGSHSRTISRIVSNSCTGIGYSGSSSVLFVGSGDYL